MEISDNSNLNLINELVQDEISKKDGETKRIEIYFQHRRDPKEYRDKLLFVGCVLGIIFLLGCFMLYLVSNKIIGF